MQWHAVLGWLCSKSFVPACSVTSGLACLLCFLLLALTAWVQPLVRPVPSAHRCKGWHDARVPLSGKAYKAPLMRDRPLSVSS